MQNSAVSGEDSGAAAENAAYSYRPSMQGAPRQFRLTGEGIDWVNGRHSGHIPFSDVQRVRLSFRPTSMQSQRFVTELWAEGAPKLKIMSSSWKSIAEQERQDKPYTAFVAELHKRVAAAAPRARYEQGGYPLVYWPGLLMFAAVALGIAALFVRALQAGTSAGALMVGGFLALFLWQGGNFFRRNRPGRYSADALPAEVLPGS